MRRVSCSSVRLRSHCRGVLHQGATFALDSAVVSFIFSLSTCVCRPTTVVRCATARGCDRHPWGADVRLGRAAAVKQAALSAESGRDGVARVRRAGHAAECRNAVRVMLRSGTVSRPSPPRKVNVDGLGPCGLYRAIAPLSTGRAQCNGLLADTSALHHRQRLDAVLFPFSATPHEPHADNGARSRGKPVAGFSLPWRSRDRCLVQARSDRGPCPGLSTANFAVAATTAVNSLCGRGLAAPPCVRGWSPCAYGSKAGGPRAPFAGSSG